MKRKFSASALAVLLCVILIIGCNAATVEAYINLAVQIALQVAQLAGLPASVAGVVSTDLTQAETLFNSLKTAEASAKPGILNRIDAILTSAEANLQNIFTTAHVNDAKLESTIRAALAIGITAIESARAIMTGTQTPTNPVTTAARIALPGGVGPKPRAMTPAQLKNLYNSTVAAYPQAQLH